ncbi:hypothetical protein BU26DRAFT_290174 [Trematosphaeria pertusa]|uniref:Uncharacterized protein n=1 Tax=Trematosphaeria pertusa TaxID=390896 RepID=A0A6A6IGV1_9PLEO|nr:uncharacterized protein BU26DRAFT_290174 [Trematosphaeria pertusa]KAF2249814.1 hypothetical protein BU26DRAFT_290174 [Trematosphaeria pertusa]
MLRPNTSPRESCLGKSYRGACQQALQETNGILSTSLLSFGLRKGALPFSSDSESTRKYGIDMLLSRSVRGAWGPSYINPVFEGLLARFPGLLVGKPINIHFGDEADNALAHSMEGLRVMESKKQQGDPEEAAALNLIPGLEDVADSFVDLQIEPVVQTAAAGIVLIFEE